MGFLRIKTTHGEIKSDFSIVDSEDGSFAVIIESKNGQGRNPDYFLALDTILESLRRAGTRITRIDVVSQKAMKVPPDERVLPLEFPIFLHDVNDIESLRKKICRAQTVVVSSAEKGGNGTKRIRIEVHATEGLTPSRFEAGLLSPDGEFRDGGTELFLDPVEAELIALDAEDDLHEDEIRNRQIEGPVEHYQLVKARRGQGVFRENVLARERACRVTGVDQPFALRASHIKPWSKSNDFEKVDGNNGLMLAPHVDALFDLGYISFAKDGAMLRSHELPTSLLAAWNIPLDVNVGPFTDAQDVFLEYHRMERFRSPASPQ